MTRKAFFKKYALKFGVTLAAVGLIVYVITHALGSSSFSLITTPLRTVTERCEFSGEAYLFRDEKLLLTEENVLVNDLVGSGEKVAKGVAVVETATQPNGDSLALLQEELDRVNRELSVLRESLLPAGTTIAKAGVYRENASAEYRSILQAVRTERLTSVGASADRFRVMLNRQALLTGGDENTVKERIAELEKLRGGLLGPARKTVSADQSGIFYSRSELDGFETVFTLDALDKLTPSSFDLLRTAEPVAKDARQAAGKLVYGYSWYLAVELDAENAGRFEQDTRYKVTFDDNGGKVLTLTLASLRKENGRTLAVFRSDEEPAGFFYYRSQRVSVTVDQYTGLYVPERAAETVDGKFGVYIFENSVAHFRTAQVIYAGDGYYLVAAGNEKDSLAQNDILILSGKNLYDGKVYS